MTPPRPQHAPRGVTFDTGALIAIEQRSHRMQALLDRLTHHNALIAIPAGALGQAWRGGPRQARIAQLLRSDMVEIVPLDEMTARAAGVLCGHAGTADVVDASVVVCARERGHTVVVTSDPRDLAALDPGLTLYEP